MNNLNRHIYFYAKLLSLTNVQTFQVDNFYMFGVPCVLTIKSKKTLGTLFDPETESVTNNITITLFDQETETMINSKNSDEVILPSGTAGSICMSDIIEREVPLLESPMIKYVVST
jgi:hypothetical protein